MFLNATGSQFGQSAKVSTEVGKSVATEVSEITLSRLDAEEGMKDHVAALKCCEQELRTKEKENCNTLIMVML